MRTSQDSGRLVAAIVVGSSAATAIVAFGYAGAPVRIVGVTEIALAVWSVVATERRALASARSALDDAHDELLRASNLESIGQLAAGVAHEINTPIQYVGDNIAFLRGAFTDLIDAAAGSSADLEFLRAEVPMALEQSATGVARVAEIVRALKGAAHPGTDGFVPTDINQLVSETTLVARGEWKRVADVELDLYPHLPEVECVRGQIGQVLLNMIVNSTHSVAARREVDASTEGRIRIATAVLGECVTITVEDNGGGVPDDIADRIFDPFFTTKAVGAGTGQGLAICHTVVYQRHGGTIDVAASASGGALFTIHLPVRQHSTNVSTIASAA